MAGWSVTMIDRSLRRQFLVLLILVGWLGVGLQTVGQGSFCDPTPGTLPLVETFLAEASTLPAEAGDGASHEECPVHRCHGSATTPLHFVRPSRRDLPPKSIVRRPPFSEFPPGWLLAEPADRTATARVRPA